MSVKFGFLSSSSADLYAVDVVKQDFPRESFFNGQRAGQGDMQSILQSEKSNIHLEFDSLTTTELSNIRRVLANRVYPHKLFLQLPATNQEYVFNDTTNKCFTKSSNDADFKDFSGSGVEFTSGEYTNINAWNDTAVVANSSSADNYILMQFTADISDFITDQGAESITRITLALKNLFLNDGNSSGDIGIGFQISYYDAQVDEYIEIKTAGITVDGDNTIYASIRPIDNFTNFANTLVGNVVKFRVRNLYANRTQGSDAVSIQTDFAKIFVNGYGCVWDGVDNFTYRDSYTGAGWTGAIDLLEL